MTSATTVPFPGLAGLLDRLRAPSVQLLERWDLVCERFTEWVAERPDLLDTLRADLRGLSATATAAIAERSREVTTHFAWKLVDEQRDPFSFWLHEYKPQRDWLQGYANTVHNHRYHFCTTVLAGGYRHEWFDVELDQSGELVRDLSLSEWASCGPGVTCMVTADRFHRIPRAKDGTLTFLVKSRPVKTWSLSFDPATRVSRRHVPVEVRVGDLANRL
jgi:hypothetical protein